MSTLMATLEGQLSRIYPDKDSFALAQCVIQEMGITEYAPEVTLHQNKWDESDVMLITYGDSIISDKDKPLKTLHRFLNKHLAEVVSSVHVLPFFPYSSDEGFSVINYSQVNDSLGDWQDIERLGEDYDVMADLVINHCSARSRWFDNFCQQKSPGKDYFIELDPDTDLAEVVRPRTSPLLRKTRTAEGEKYVWCTFSHDQVDLNFANPEVLLEMVRIIRRYLEQGVKVFRLDAVAFLWKEVGTPCVHLPQTHEVVRMLRSLIEAHTESAIVITETNVPNHENLSYFGNANEAHGVYNFALPPLLLHALLTGNSDHLKRWQMSMPPAQNGTFYFNFIASHDGIGLRPVKGLLDEKDIDQLINTLQSFGARVSWRSISEGLQEPYEVNVALFDALQGTSAGPDKWHLARFLCAHAIMVALEGIPAIYIHSFLGTSNDLERLELTRHNRNINRKKWAFDEIESQLDNEFSQHSKALNSLKKLLVVRKQQPAFHPNAVQYTLHLGSEVFAFWRQSINRDQSIFCLHNVSDNTVELPISSINLISLEKWTDLVSGEEFQQDQTVIKLKPYQFIWLSNK